MVTSVSRKAVPPAALQLGAEVVRQVYQNSSPAWLCAYSQEGARAQRWPAIRRSARGGCRCWAGWRCRPGRPPESASGRTTSAVRRLVVRQRVNCRLALPLMMPVKVLVDQVPEVGLARLRRGEEDRIVGDVALDVPGGTEQYTDRLLGGAEVDVGAASNPDVRGAVELGDRPSPRSRPGRPPWPRGRDRRRAARKQTPWASSNTTSSKSGTTHGCVPGLGTGGSAVAVSGRPDLGVGSRSAPNEPDESVDEGGSDGRTAQRIIDMPKPP